MISQLADTNFRPRDVADKNADAVTEGEHVCRMSCVDNESELEPLNCLLTSLSEDHYAKHSKRIDSYVFIAHKNNRILAVLTLCFPCNANELDGQYRECIDDFLLGEQMDVKSENYNLFNQAKKNNKLVYIGLLASFGLSNHGTVPGRLWYRAITDIQKEREVETLSICAYTVGGITIRGGGPDGSRDYHNHRGNERSMRLQENVGMKTIGAGQREHELEVPRTPFICELFPSICVTGSHDSLILSTTVHRELRFGEVDLTRYLRRR
ncbi:hypothetical protein [Planctomycetes bacterium CA13]